MHAEPVQLAISQGSASSACRLWLDLCALFGCSHASAMSPEAFEALAFLDTLASTSRLAFGFNRSGRAPHVLVAS